ncbi:MAG: hypothetical protein IKG25_02325 [Mogibacterium sp.]|nr:hypothetical protein [Mogibacterium sp.]
MEAVWTALIAMGSAIVVKLLDWILNRRNEKKGAIAQLNNKVDKIASDLKSHINENREQSAIQARQRIQRFNDELLRGQKHTKEYFDSILIDITDYDRYCNEHEEFRNQVTSMAEENIKRVYRKCQEERSFL